MRILLLTLSLFTALSLSAQFGGYGAYNLNEIRYDANTLGEPTDFQLDNGYEVGLHYWFRLPKQRVEFYPTVYAATAAANITGARQWEYGFQLRTNLYLFDFAEDCDCPTFGKQGPALEKGFFLQLAPGYALYRPDGGRIGLLEKSSGFTFGGGVGLDIGVTNLLTVTPFAGVRYGTGGIVDFETTDVNGQVTDGLRGRLTTVHLGLSATFRLDHKRY